MARVHGQIQGTERFFLLTNFYIHFSGIRICFWNIGHWFWVWEETLNFGYSAQLDLVFLQVHAYESDFYLEQVLESWVFGYACLMFPCLVLLWTILYSHGMQTHYRLSYELIILSYC